MEIIRFSADDVNVDGLPGKDTSSGTAGSTWKKPLSPGASAKAANNPRPAG